MKPRGRRPGARAPTRVSRRRDGPSASTDGGAARRAGRRARCVRGRRVAPAAQRRHRLPSNSRTCTVTVAEPQALDAATDEVTRLARLVDGSAARARRRPSRAGRRGRRGGGVRSCRGGNLLAEEQAALHDRRGTGDAAKCSWRGRVGARQPARERAMPPAETVVDVGARHDGMVEPRVIDDGPGVLADAQRALDGPAWPVRGWSGGLAPPSWRSS